MMKHPANSYTEEEASILEMKEITKTFPGVKANDHINFRLKRGEVHSILGENGAGKTTLMNILYGLYRMDEGEILLNGHAVSIRSPKDAMNLGIGMVQQFSALIPGLSVIENILLGNTASEGFLIRREEHMEELRRIMDRLGLEVDLQAQSEHLTVGEKQKVEVVRALHRENRILILDEPFSELTPQEKGEGLKALKSMVKGGELSSIIFITHKLPDAMTVSDRVTVLRDGRVVDVLEIAETSIRQLARKMVGRGASKEMVRPDVCKGEDMLLEVKGVSIPSVEGRGSLKTSSLYLRRREILGIAGVSGSGQRELVEAIIGLRGVKSGSITIKGREVTKLTPRKIRRLGVGFIPEDRERGILPQLSVAENLVLGIHFTSQLTHPWILPLNKELFMKKEAVEEYAKRLVADYQVKVRDVNQPAGDLSGGNMLKLILARELSRCLVLLVADKPTSGLDLNSQEQVRRRLMEKREKGTAIILISEDLDEILRISDRIAVMYEGGIIGIIPAKDATKERIGGMMAGLSID